MASRGDKQLSFRKADPRRLWDQALLPAGGRFWSERSAIEGKHRQGAVGGVRADQLAWSYSVGAPLMNLWRINRRG